MASAITHFVVGAALALPAMESRVLRGVLPRWAIPVTSGLLAVAPDLDTVAMQVFHIPHGSLFGHRGFFHSALFLALFAAALAAALALRAAARAAANSARNKAEWKKPRWPNKLPCGMWNTCIATVSKSGATASKPLVTGIAHRGSAPRRTRDSIAGSARAAPTTKCVIAEAIPQYRQLFTSAPDGAVFSICSSIAGMRRSRTVPDDDGPGGPPA